jgi:hypothetical protein
MSRLFVSHSSQNNAEAEAIRIWLAECGFDDVFLDFDPERLFRPEPVRCLTFLTIGSGGHCHA